MSGHSKWSQIKHKKALTDAKKGRLFSKLVREIMAAVSGGGPDTQGNVGLRTAIERARALGLPKDNIERAVSRAAGGGKGTALQEFLYEAAAQGEVAILIEGLTDNKNRTLAEIRHVLSRHRAKLANPGSILWGFDRVGLIEIAKADNAAKTVEEIELAIIESGAHDYKMADGTWVAETGFESRDKIRRELEKRGITIKESGHDYKPRVVVEATAETRTAVEPLLDALADHNDVQEVYTNLSEG